MGAVLGSFWEFILKPAARTAVDSGWLSERGFGGILEISGMGCCLDEDWGADHSVTPGVWLGDGVGARHTTPASVANGESRFGPLQYSTGFQKFDFDTENPQYIYVLVV